MSFNESSKQIPRTPSYSLPRKPLRAGSYSSLSPEDASIRTHSGYFSRAASSQHSSIPLLEVTQSPYSVAEEGPFGTPESSLDRRSERGMKQNSHMSGSTINGSDNITYSSVPLTDDNDILSMAAPTTEDKESIKTAEVCVEEEEKKLTHRSEQDLPDWRPSSLEKIHMLVTFVVLVVVGYIVLYVRSKFRGSVTPDGIGFELMFRYGPAFLAVIIQEAVFRMRTDLDSILPYIALSSRERSGLRTKTAAQLTEPERNKKTLRTKLLIRYCTFILVPIQSTLLSHGSRHYKTVTGNFRMVQPDQVISSLDDSSIPALALDSVWHGQPFASIKWLSVIESAPNSSDYMVITPDYAGVMPFQSLSSVSTPESWTVRTSAIYGYLNCSEIGPKDITVSVSDIWVGNSGLEITRLSVRLVDKEGCTFQRTWANASSGTAPGNEDPITNDGKFALWQALDGHEVEGQTPSSCLRYKHFIASGPLTVSYTDGPDLEKMADTGANSGWAAISCQPMYRVLNDTIYYNTGDGEKESDETTTIDFGDGDALNPEADDMNRPMNRHLLENGLVYNLSSPVFRRTFWNQPAQNAFGPLQDTYSAWYSDFDIDEGCRDVSSKTNVWDNDDACQMYANVATLWPLLVAATVSLSALYVPVEDQIITKGTVHTYRTGWYLTGFELTCTIVLHAFLLFLIYDDGLLHTPKWIRGRSSFKTGLYGTPSSIAGRAFVFQHKSLHPLFEGLDTLRPERAIEKSRKRFSLVNSKLLLRKWNDGEDGEVDDTNVSYAMIRPKDGKIELEETEEPDEILKRGKAVVWMVRIWKKVRWNKRVNASSRLGRTWRKIRPSKADRDARRLVYGTVPTMLNPIFLALLWLSIAAILIVTYKFIILSKSSGFQMWFQPTYALSHETREDAKRYIQKGLFKGLPAGVLLAIGYWWENIERYYRATEPYAALANGANGRKSVCLDYIHSYHLVASWKALWNRHWSLAHVTFTTFLIKVCIVLASGIFSMNEIGHKPGRDLELSRDWRETNFADSGLLDHNFNVSLRRFTISRAVFGYPKRPGWGKGEWVFPSVVLDGPQFQLNLTGYAGFLDCEQTDIVAGNVSGNISISVVGDQCQETEWESMCPSPTEDKEKDQRCMAWRYLPNCTGGEGRWWIVSLTRSPTSTSGSVQSISNFISLLCKPRIKSSNAEIRVTRDEDEETVWINSMSYMATEIPSTRWKDPGDGVDFITFSSKLLQGIFANEVYHATGQTWLDYFSTITILESRNGTESTDLLFQSATALASAVSKTYSNVFAALISQNLYSNKTEESSTLLFETAPYPTRPSRTVPVSPLANMATKAKGPLYAACFILTVYWLGIPFVWPKRRRRMALNVAYPANAITMIYDSFLLEEIRNCDETKDFKALYDRQFAIGYYTGVSGTARLGIDFKERVTVIRKKERSYLLQ